jgi:CAAX protease family protein
VNSAPEISVADKTSRINPVWRGQLFLFDAPRSPTYSSLQGYKLLAIFVFVEVIVRLLTRYEARSLGIAQRDWWTLLQVSVLLALALLLSAGFAGVPLSELGLSSWRRWSKIEKFYFPQILAISVAIFVIAQYSELKLLWVRSDLGRITWLIFASQMIWGFYQEFMYRGILQTELVRRCGAPMGILLSNLIFTFGPLHYYHFSLARQHAAHLWIFVGIFFTGLYFAILVQRSGNLWIAGILHGVGDWFIDGLAEVSRMTR